MTDSPIPSDPRVDCGELTTHDGCTLFLRRGIKNHDKGAVLLLHGGSASCDTFLEPAGASLFDFLNVRFDVWMLDWRGSHYVADAQPDIACRPMDHVAEFDIPRAVEFIQECRIAEHAAPEIAVVAHCLGAACLAMALGAGHVKPEAIPRIVFATIGLFYEVSWDGWSKLQDRMLERIADRDPTLVSISPDPRVDWPPELKETFEMWPKVWGSPWREAFFQRLTYMFGQPFLVSNLSRAMTREKVRAQFGAIPLTIYRQALQNTLRGYAAPFDAEGCLDPHTPNKDIPEKLSQRYLNVEPFRQLSKILLITGDENPLWHRESIDRMSEWLTRGGAPPTKRILTGYGHQDLWWGKNSSRDVFPLICEAIVAQGSPDTPCLPAPRVLAGTP